MPFTADSKATTDFAHWEGNEEFTREEIDILAGSGAARVLTAGMVLAVGSIAVTETAIADAGNTGTGVMGAVTAGEDVKEGTYELECIAIGTDVGTFAVRDPDGIPVKSVTGTDLIVATAFDSDHFDVTLADGATDFALGDRFRIVMSAPVTKYVRHETTGADGSEIPAGLLFADVTAPDGTDAKGVGIIRGPALINQEQIVHDANATAAEKSAVLAALERLGIVARAGAGAVPVVT